MKIDEKIISEIKRYNFINNYISEQEAGAAPPPPAAEPVQDDATALAGPPPSAPTGDTTAAQVDITNDPDVEEVSPEGDEGDTEELDITDLVDSQKTMADKQEEYFENLFNQIKSMEEKFTEMDSIVQKIDLIDAKVEKYRPKTAQEKLELRSLDSGPFKQNLSDFFKDKEEEMERSGKNEYVLTRDEVENFSPSDIEKTFNEPVEDEDDILLNRYNS